MAASKLQFKRNIINKLSVKGTLSKDGTFISYTDENDVVNDIKISDLLNAFKNQDIELSVQLKQTDDLDIVPADDEITDIYNT